LSKGEREMKPTRGGIHHITAIASDPQRNIDFYVGFLGLRLVKQTVNFDAPTISTLFLDKPMQFVFYFCGSSDSVG